MHSSAQWCTVINRRGMLLAGVLLYVLTVVVPRVTADYNCVCNDNIYSVKVFQEKSQSSTIIGHLDYAQCKQEMCAGSGQQWVTIEYETQFGYIDGDSIVEHNLCSGSPPGTKSTTVPCESNTFTPSSTTEATTTTTTMAPITSTVPTTKVPTTPAPTTIAPTYTVPTTAIPKTTVHTHAPTDASHTGAHGNVDGNVQLCPFSLRDGAAKLHDALGHFGTKCYALDPHLKESWGSAERTCVKYGAHLVHITSAIEQEFVHNFVAKHAPGQAIWIGLNDILREGTYSWSNGGWLHYNHWYQHHFNIQSYHTDDCVAMRTDGYWDDINCGHSIFGHDYGTKLLFPCEFDYGQTQSIFG